MARTADTPVTRVVREFKAALAAREDAQSYIMAERYLQIEKKLRNLIEALTEQIARLKAEGRSPTLGMIYRLGRWQALQGQVLVELAEYNGWALALMRESQRDFGNLGAQAAAQALKASGSSLVAAFENLPASAIEAMVGLAGDGSPLAVLLAEAYPAVHEAMATALVRGVALGQNPRKVAQEVARGLNVGYERAFLIARTEELRAFRSAAMDSYKEAGVMYYERLSAQDERVCAGCLAAEGEVYPTDEVFDAHPACRCTMVPIVPGAATPVLPSAEDWFNAQDETTRLNIMGPGRLGLYDSGAVQWSDLWTRTSDPTWGGAIVPTRVSDLKAGGATPMAQAA